MSKPKFEQRELSAKRQRLTRHITEQISGFEIKSKQDSLLMKILSYLVFFNKKFMTSFVTTAYPKVYVPQLPWKEGEHIGAIATLAHEYVHLSDRKRMGWLFNLLYISPQVLFVFGLLSFYSLWFMLFFLFILPIPSIGRAWLEFRAYRMTMACYYWLSDYELPTDWLARYFTNSSYYWMFPFKKYISNKFKEALVDIKKDKLTPELLEIKKVIMG
tara:strand:- start:598 stop:1245 length:648 start_codon:yes stop_codon:yes gene_type:complete